MANADLINRIDFRLQQLLDARGLTYKDVKELTDGEVAESTISDLITRRKQLPSGETWVRICDALEIQPQDIFSIRPKAA